MKFLFPFLLFTTSIFAQNSARLTVLDSLNASREKDRGAFNLYIKKPDVEIIGGVFRNRVSTQQGFKPITFTYHIYLPFQFDLNYVNLKAKDKLMKINTALILHHSKYGNYALGLSNRFSFLLFKKTYMSYQIGIVWCEPVKKNSDDGINYMGFSLHHEFSLSYNVTDRVRLSANILHISNGNLFKGVENLQDVLGLGAAYSF